MPFKITPRLEERINARWQVWHPWILILARKRLPFVDTQRTLEQCRSIHHDRYIQAMAQNISEPVIINNSLDDPRLDMAQFRFKVEEILRKRLGYISRVKGIRRTRKQVREDRKCQQTQNVS